MENPARVLIVSANFPAMNRYALPPTWAKEINNWATALKVADRSAQTIETRTEHLRRFARQTGAGGPALVSRNRLIDWAGSQDWARETRRSIYTSIRAFYAWAYETERVADNISDALPRVKASEPAPRPAPENVYRVSLANADARARLILRLAGEAGLRRGEIAQISKDDLTRDLMGYSLRVHGKGGKVRTVPLTEPLARVLIEYLGRRYWLFPSPSGGHLTPRHVGKLASKVMPDIWTLHTLRHRFATVTYDGTRDLIVIQQLLGHSSVATTQRYIAAPQDRLRQAVAVASVV